MNYKMFSIYDRVSGLYGELFFAQKEELAIRRFNYLMKNSPMVAPDCDLYCVGDFNSDTGLITALSKPVFIIRYEVKSE